MAPEGELVGPETICVRGGARLAQSGIPSILNAHGHSLVDSPNYATAIAGWGRKRSGLRAQQEANDRSLRPLFLEDAFVRSCGIGQLGAPPLGLLVDAVGVHYDASAPSSIENMLNEAVDFDKDMLTRARSAIAHMVELELSKYNMPFEPRSSDYKRPYSLVLDQTPGDISIAYGRAGEEHFRSMLEAALAETDAHVVIRSHPAASRSFGGTRVGHLTNKSIARWGLTSSRIHFDDGGPLWPLIKGAERVYAVTSLAGFEARLAGKQTEVFGMPFYAGWGESGDRQKHERRRSRRGAVEIFCASYLKAAIYYDPHMDSPCTLERVFEIIEAERASAQRLLRPVRVVGMWPRKRRFVSLHLRDAAPGVFEKKHVTFHWTWWLAVKASQRQGGAVAAWSAKISDKHRAMVKQAGCPLLEVEDGFLRSIGRGAIGTFPVSLVLDDLGIYCDARRPSRLETMIRENDVSEKSLAAARDLIHRYRSAPLSKYNLTDRHDTLPASLRNPFLLVVGQVEDDVSIRRGTQGNVRTNSALIEQVRKENRDAIIAYRPHPDVSAGDRKGTVSEEFLVAHDCVDATDLPLFDLLGSTTSVHTMTSLTGLEALMRGRKVVCHGAPFYAGWGLTEDRLPTPRRNRPRTLEELIALAYVDYPSYVDPDSLRFTSVAQIASKFQQWVSSGANRPGMKPSRETGTVDAG